ncbi:hypothetical protein H1R20_g7935, partial [Candolleomyces eurysporus]
MIAARLLPIAVAVVLSLHARLTLALPVDNEDLSLRSVSVANDDASSLALREPSEEDELLDLVQRTPQAKGLLDLINRLPGINTRPPPGPIEELAIRTIEDEIMEELLHRGYYDDMDLD